MYFKLIMQHGYCPFVMKSHEIKDLRLVLEERGGIVRCTNSVNDSSLTLLAGFPPLNPVKFEQHSETLRCFNLLFVLRGFAVTQMNMFQTGF